MAKLNGVNLIELTWKKWNGLPETFIDQINKSHKLTKSQIKLFWLLIAVILKKTSRLLMN